MFNNNRIGLKCVFAKKEVVKKCENCCKLEKTSGEATEIDSTIRSLFRRRARIYKRICHGGTIASHISGELVGHAEE